MGVVAAATPGWRRGRSLAGFAVGVIVRESHHPLIPGDLQNATTFDFPVLFGVVPQVTAEELFSGSQALGERVLATGDALVAQGVRAIVGACGSFVNYQAQAAARFQIPTAMSVMVQIPFLLSLLPQDKKLAIIFAAARSLTPAVLGQSGIRTEHMSRLVIAEGCGLPAFAPFLDREFSVDAVALDAQLRDHASELVRKNPEVAMIALQCSNLPPFAASIQDVTGVPVVDGSLLVNWMFSSLTRRPYVGYF